MWAVHAAGRAARVACRRNHGSEEFVEGEITSQRLKELGLAVGDPVLLCMRRRRRFAEDFMI
jgi:hypothetical protein